MGHLVSDAVSNRTLDQINCKSDWMWLVSECINLKKSISRLLFKET